MILKHASQQTSQRWCLALILAACATGCGGPTPVTGGTPGTLRFGKQPSADIQLTVHQRDSMIGDFLPIGIATTGNDGSFTLVKNSAEGPLRLSPGTYRITLESAGNPAPIPPEYSSWTTTPLKVTWGEGDTHLELETKD